MGFLVSKNAQEKNFPASVKMHYSKKDAHAPVIPSKELHANH